jgi:hypothetical protein
VLGDLTNDRQVDLADWTSLKTNMGLDTSALAVDQRLKVGDLNQNGSVGLEDFVSFRNIFRSVISDGSALAAHRLVPEPSSLSLLIIGWLVLANNDVSARRSSAGIAHSDRL